MQGQLARQTIGVRGGGAGPASGGQSAKIRRKLYEERRRLIEAEDKTELLESERKRRQDLVKDVRIIEFSR